MREIKFRTWDRENNEMLASIFDQPCTTEWFIRDDDYIVMQYTGIKDKNGVEIYEGDIVKDAVSKLDKNLFEVVYGGHWKYSAFGIQRKRQDDEFGSQPYTWDVLSHRWNDLEVIGNIYSNPELLEVAS